jgi:hypothetical protein
MEIKVTGCHDLKYGDPVEWTYKHWLNSKQFTFVTKAATFIRYVRPLKKFTADWSATKKAVIKVYGNKNNSTVLATELSCPLKQDSITVKLNDNDKTGVHKERE